MRRMACSARVGLADDLDVVLGLEQVPQAATNHIVVVQEEHPDRHVTHCGR